MVVGGFGGGGEGDKGGDEVGLDWEGGGGVSELGEEGSGDGGEVVRRLPEIWRC